MLCLEGANVPSQPQEEAMTLKACVECGYLTTFVTTCPQCSRCPHVALGLRMAGTAAVALTVCLAVLYFAKADELQSALIVTNLCHG